MKLARYENFLVLLVLTLILVGPIWGKISPEGEPGAVTDYVRYLGEYEAAGALKFYDNTEAILRLAQFEQALMRYRFLKGQILGKVDYSGLLNMVDLRLQFLKKQLHLRETEVAAIPPRKIKRAVPKPPEVKPPPEKPKADKPKGDDEEKAKEGPAISGTIGPPGKAAPPPVTAVVTPPPAAAPAKAKEDVKTEEDKEAEEAKPPPPPPGFWEKLKIRLHLKKKAE